MSELTLPMVKILEKELAMLISEGFISSHEDLLAKIEIFGNMCLIDTHTGACSVLDEELSRYFSQLTLFALIGGFEGKHQYLSSAKDSKVLTLLLFLALFDPATE
jgi:hypothetical protein